MSSVKRFGKAIVSKVRKACKKVIKIIKGNKDQTKEPIPSSTSAPIVRSSAPPRNSARELFSKNAARLNNPVREPPTNPAVVAIK
ncbi:hypothetical protein MP638_007117, partial [Amoeboaphelidium occidentale]